MNSEMDLDPRDVEHWANAKLGDPWSGQALQLDQAKLKTLVSVFRHGKLDQLVKVRLLLACALLHPGTEPK
jgi:hypothetical protein